MLGRRLTAVVAGLATVAAAGCTTYRIVRHRQPDARKMGMFAKRVVRRADAPFVFARAPRMRDDMDTVTVLGAAGTRMPFSQYMRDHRVLAFLVIRNDTILYERYRDGLTDSTPHNAFSVSKSFLSALVGIALGEGKIRSLDDPVVDYVTELRGRPAFEGVTVGHLIGMRSGLRFTETGRGPLHDLRSDAAHVYYTTDLAKWVRGVPRVEPPGSRWNYKDVDAELLGLVLRRATGRTVAEYMEEKLWRRIGAERDASWNLDRANGQERVASGFNAVARDYARFGRLYLEGGAWGGERVVPAAWVAASVAVDTSRTEPEVLTWWQMQHTLYWWHPLQPPAREFYADGSHGQRVYVDPATRTIVVQLANESRQDFPFRKLVAYLGGNTWQYPRFIPALVRQAAVRFGADSVRPVLERLLAERRRAPERFVVTHGAMRAVVKLLVDDPKTRDAGRALERAVAELYP